MLQDIRSGSLDVLTPGELSKQLHEHLHPDKWTQMIMAHYRGVKVMKLPVQHLQATGTTASLFEQNGVQSGPESGFFWMLRSLYVGSNDASTFNLIAYIDADGSAQPFSVLENGGITANKRYYPGSKSIFLFPGEQVYCTLSTLTAGKTYYQTGVVIEAPMVMAGKLAI